MAVGVELAGQRGGASGLGVGELDKPSRSILRDKHAEGAVALDDHLGGRVGAGIAPAEFSGRSGERRAVVDEQANLASARECVDSGQHGAQRQGHPRPFVLKEQLGRPLHARRVAHRHLRAHLDPVEVEDLDQPVAGIHELPLGRVAFQNQRAEGALDRAARHIEAGLLEARVRSPEIPSERLELGFPRVIDFLGQRVLFQEFGGALETAPGVGLARADRHRPGPRLAQRQP